MVSVGHLPVLKAFVSFRFLSFPSLSYADLSRLLSPFHSLGFGPQSSR
jgi:hypothetical protein